MRAAARSAKRQSTMKIAELARRAGVSRETIHFYVREGLLPRPVKAGQTVAFYSDEHLERLLLVRRLREEKFLPLSVIRRLLQEGRVRPGVQDIELLSEISQISPTDEADEDRPVATVARALGVPAETLERAGELGLVDPGGRLGPGDRRVLAAIAEAAGLSATAREAALAGMRACKGHVDQMVADEAGLFFDSLLRDDPGQAVAALVASRPAVAHYVAAYRARCLHGLVDRTLEEVDAGVAAAARSATRPLSTAARERGGYERSLAMLEGRAHAPGAPAAAILDLLRLHFGVGDAVALDAEIARLSGTFAEDPHVLFYAGVARSDLRDVPGGLALLSRAAAAEPRWALARAHRAATLLRGLAARDGKAPSGSVLVDGTRGIAELDEAAALPATPEDQRWVQYLRARVALMLPAGFRRHDEARAVLERLANEPLPTTDLEGVRLRANARLALGLPSQDVGP